MIDPLIEAMFLRLPEPGQIWPLEYRNLWIEGMRAILNLTYYNNEFHRDVVGPARRAASDRAQEVLEQINTDEEQANLADAAVSEVRLPIPVDKVDERHEDTLAPPPKRQDRPAGIPTNFTMFQAILVDKPGLLAKELITEVEKRYWPGVTFERLGREVSTWVQEARIARDEDCRLTLTEIGKPHHLREKPKPAPPPAMPPAPNSSRMFVYGSKPISLELVEFEVAELLRRAMGRGFLDYKNIASRVRKTGSGGGFSDKQWLAQVIPGLTEKLRPVGLEIFHRDDFGYEMKRTVG